MFHHSLKQKGMVRFQFWFVKTGPATAVPPSAHGKTVPMVPVSSSGSVPESPGKLRRAMLSNAVVATLLICPSEAASAVPPPQGLLLLKAAQHQLAHGFAVALVLESVLLRWAKRATTRHRSSPWCQ